MDSEAKENQLVVDKEHLKLLSICHYVVAGISALFSCFFIFHIFMGWSILHDPSFFGAGATGNAPPPFVGYFMMGAGIVAVSIGWIYGGLLAYAGKCLASRKHRTFILVMAGLSCCNMPLGLILGVFTFIVMFRSSVRELFGTPGGSTNLAASNPVSLPTLATVADPDETVWEELEKKSKQEEEAKHAEKSQTETVERTGSEQSEVIDLKKMQES